MEDVGPMIEGTGLKAVFALERADPRLGGATGLAEEMEEALEGNRRLWNSWRNFHPWEEWKLGQELEKEPDGSHEEGLGHKQREKLSVMDQTPWTFWSCEWRSSWEGTCAEEYWTCCACDWTLEWA